MKKTAARPGRGNIDRVLLSGESGPKMSLPLREDAESRVETKPLFRENPVGCNKADDEVEKGA